MSFSSLISILFKCFYKSACAATGRLVFPFGGVRYMSVALLIGTFGREVNLILPCKDFFVPLQAKRLLNGFIQIDETTKNHQINH